MMGQQQNDAVISLMSSVLALPQLYEKRHHPHTLVYGDHPAKEEGKLPFTVQKSFLYSELSVPTRLHLNHLLLTSLATLPQTSRHYLFKVDSVHTNFVLKVLPFQAINIGCWVRHPLTHEGIELAVDTLAGVELMDDAIDPSQ